MRTAWLAAFALAVSTAAAQAPPAAVALSDAPDPSFVRPRGHDGPATYAEALRTWASADDVNAWIGARFVYDSDRALALSESARAAGPAPAVTEPAAFHAHPRGVCVDLARFAVDTLRAVEPAVQPAYLMIEFAPVRVAGQVLRRHWMATFRRDDGHYFFADSKRPGHLAGPYASVEAFVTAYAAYRGRPVVAHRVLPSYARQARQSAQRALRVDAPAAVPRERALRDPGTPP